MNTILIIEDDLNVRKMVRDFLELQKFTVITAEDGAHGIELALRLVPDLIICDIQMPGKDGYQVKDELAKNKIAAFIPFIYLSSKAERKDLRKGMELGADDYLFKPFDMKELLNSIEVQLEKKEKLIKEYGKKQASDKNSNYSYQDHILLKVNGTPKFIQINSITLVTADEKYTKVNLSSGEKLIISKSLKEWEELLPSNNFLRVHRANIVNIEYIGKVEKWFNRGYKIKIKNSTEEVVISRRYYTQLRDIFNN